MKFSYLFFSATFCLFLGTLQTHAMDPDAVVEYIYDRSVTYSPGAFSHYREGTTTLSTHPQPPQASYTQKALVYNKNPQEFIREKVLKKVIPGQDGRIRVTQTTSYPHSMCVQLTMIFQGNVYGGSGSFAGPQHIVTCGHNAYDPVDRIWADEILVYPALNDAHAPFGELKVVKVYTFKGWVTQGQEHLDMAVLVLSKPIGKYTGWAGLLSLDDRALAQEKVNITGYPGDKGLKQMWTMAHTLKTIKPDQFYYEIDTAGGQSGSPIWINKWGTPMILGVHTAGSTSINSGVRISGKKFMNFLMRAISETYTLDALPSASFVDLSPAPPSRKQQTVQTPSPPSYKADTIWILDDGKDGDINTITASSASTYRNSDPLSRRQEAPTVTGLGSAATGNAIYVTPSSDQLTQYTYFPKSSLSSQRRKTPRVPLVSTDYYGGNKSPAAINLADAVDDDITMTPASSSSPLSFEEWRKGLLLLYHSEPWARLLLLECTSQNITRLGFSKLPSRAASQSLLQSLAKVNLPNLTELYFDHNNMGDVETQSVANGNFPNLKTLTLMYNEIGAAGAHSLANGKLGTLTTLSLQNNIIGAAGAHSLANGNLTNLTWLNLCNNGIGDAGMQSLAKGNFTNLRELYLYSNNIHDEGLRSLLKGNLHNLKCLKLMGNSIYTVTCDAVHQRYPALVLDFN